MVSRITLMFWRWVHRWHDALHHDRMEDENVTYTSPAVHYLGGRDAV
jgi:hypothetical protein